MLVYAQCRDCETSSLTEYHVIGLKCQICGGYNTVRDIGPFYRSDELSCKLFSYENKCGASIVYHRVWWNTWLC